MPISIEPVQRALDAIGARYALIGAHALAARGSPRFTVDIDLLTTSSDPLAGVVDILLPDDTDIDFILAKWKWEADLIDRSEVMTVSPGVQLAVPQTSDLILVKRAAGGSLDLSPGSIP